MVRQLFNDRADAAIDEGVSGCPSFIVDGEMIWGADRLDRVGRWLAAGGW